MDKNAKYVVVGFPKCGQNSLVTYLTRQGYDVVRDDQIWRSNSRQRIDDRYPDRIPIIITRDPVEMIWSSYNYWYYKDAMSFEKYLDYRVQREGNIGYENPLDNADYEKHINKFLDKKPIMFKFEEMLTIPGFPHENPTHIDFKGTPKPPIPKKYRELVQSRLDSRKDLT